MTKNPLFDTITQKDNKTFSQNSLIAKLENERKWTVSDTEKRPVDIPHLIKTQQVIPAKLDVTGQNYPLVTLKELNSYPELEHTNRTLRLSSIENRVFMIDIEPKASDETLLKWASFPAQYTEVSTNGGLHLLIQVPESLINEDNEYIFDGLTQIKDGENNEVEYLFNRHYITFTKRIPLEKPNATFAENTAEYEQLKQLLAHLVKIDEKRKNARLIAQQQQEAFTKDNINKEIIKNQLTPTHGDGRQSLFYSLTLGDAKFMELLPKLEDHNNDASLMEYVTALKILHKIIKNVGYLYGQGDATIRYHDNKDKILSFTRNDYIYLAATYLKMIVPSREKHDEFRSNLPWLIYVTNNAYNYIKADFIENEASGEKRKDHQFYAAFYSTTPH